MCLQKLILVALFVTSVVCTPLNRLKKDTVPTDNVSNESFSNERSNDQDGDVQEIQSKQYESEMTKVLGEYFDKYISPALEASRGKSKLKFSNYFDKQDGEGREKMQGDMPKSDVVLDTVALKIFLPISNSSQSLNSTIMTSFFNQTRSIVSHEPDWKERYTEDEITERAKKGWLDVIKNNILQNTGRKNDTSQLSPEVWEQVRQSLNRSAGLPIIRTPNLDSENSTAENYQDIEYVEKIRSFYPSCDIPRNTDEDLWKDINTMNLYFTVDYNNHNQEIVNIASATLRLYKLPQIANSNSTENCQKNDNAQYLSDEDKQIRVSVYWYSKSLKKHRAVKRRLSDSRMVPLIDKHNIHYVEFNIRPATKSWVRGRNLGLGVVVEDMDGTVLPADKHFRGVGCHMVGNVSTPKPIPTVVVDAYRSRLQGASNSSDHSTYDFSSLLPIIDICTIELHTNYTQDKSNKQAIICKYFKNNEPSTKKVFADETEKVAFTELIEMNSRHIRHQKQHQKKDDSRDPRHNIQHRRLVMTSSQVEQLSQSLKGIERNSTKTR